MTTFRLPIEPDAGAILWTLNRETYSPLRWTSLPDVDRGHVWHCDETRQTRDWPGLLELGPVSDRHPTLAGLAPTPWTTRYSHIEDSHGGRINLEDHAYHIVQAVNDYAARLEAGPTVEDKTVTDEDVEQAFEVALAEDTAARRAADLVHFWRGVTSSERRDAVSAECGGLVDLLDGLVRAHSLAGK
jgi:hypothetical protein